MSSKATKRKHTTKQEEEKDDKNVLLPDLEDVGHGVNYHFFEEKEIAEVRAQLLQWYDKHQRTLPWRVSDSKEAQQKQTLPDLNVRGYQVWVSEVMLQQTR